MHATRRAIGEMSGFRRSHPKMSLLGNFPLLGATDSGPTTSTAILQATAALIAAPHPHSAATMEDNRNQDGNMASTTATSKQSFCPDCQDDPCHVVAYGDVLAREAADIGKLTSAASARKRLYQVYVGAVHGMLGKHNRVEIPKCVVSFIRSLFPSRGGDYMGHKWE